MMQNRLNIRILHIALLFLLSAGCLLPHAAYATPLQDDLIAIRTAMQAELASDRDYGEMNRQAKTFEERSDICDRLRCTAKRAGSSATKWQAALKR